MWLFLQPLKRLVYLMGVKEAGLFGIKWSSQFCEPFLPLFIAHDGHFGDDIMEFATKTPVFTPGAKLFPVKLGQIQQQSDIAMLFGQDFNRAQSGGSPPW